MADKRLLIPVEVRMSDFGYWVVTISCAPAKRMSIMICRPEVSPTQATKLALTGVTHVLERGTR